MRFIIDRISYRIDKYFKIYEYLNEYFFENLRQALVSTVHKKFFSLGFEDAKDFTILLKAINEITIIDTYLYKKKKIKNRKFSYRFNT